MASALVQTNWASILSQGLKVAPPEAPSSGYMFDKGLYFADMVRRRLWKTLEPRRADPPLS